MFKFSYFFSVHFSFFNGVFHILCARNFVIVVMECITICVLLVVAKTEKKKYLGIERDFFSFRIINNCQKTNEYLNTYFFQHGNLKSI